MRFVPLAQPRLRNERVAIPIKARYQSGCGAYDRLASHETMMTMRSEIEAKSVCVEANPDRSVLIFVEQ